MTRPTHILKATGDLVFPQNYSPEEVELAPAGHFEALSFLSAKEAKRVAIDAARDDHRAKGYSPTAGPMAGHTLQARQEDQNNWNTSFGVYTVAVSRGAAAVSGASFRTAANQNVTLTYEEGLGVLVDMAAWGGAVFANSWALKNAVAAATTQAELDAIDPSQGWP